MTETIKWDKKDVWTARGKNFCVEVDHWTREPYEWSTAMGMTREGGHHWNVYAYVYPEHKLFSAIKEERSLYELPNELHFHGGVTFFQKHNINGEDVSIQFGSDYSHLYDEHFSFQGTKEDADEVFRDAEMLYKQLAEMA